MEPSVTLASDGLLSKWGFSDGDAPEDFLDYCDDHGIPYPDWHALLQRIIRQHLLPALDQHVEIVVISTSHNPVRARTVDGRNVEDGWHGGNDSLHLTPSTITIPVDVILAMAANPQDQ